MNALPFDLNRQLDLERRARIESGEENAMSPIDQRAAAAHRDRMALLEARAKWDAARRHGSAGEVRAAGELAEFLARRRKFGVLALIVLLVLPILLIVAGELSGTDPDGQGLTTTQR